MIPPSDIQSHPYLTLNVNSQAVRYASPNTYNSGEKPHLFETRFYGFIKEFANQQGVDDFKIMFLKILQKHNIDSNLHMDNLIYFSLFFEEIYQDNLFTYEKRKNLHDKAKFIISLIDSPYDSIKKPITTTYYDVNSKKEITKEFNKEEFDILSIEQRVGYNLLGDIIRINVSDTKYIPVSKKISISVRKDFFKGFSPKIPLHNWDIVQLIVKALIDEQKEGETAFYKCLLDPKSTILDLWNLSKKKVRGKDSRWNFALVGIGKMVVSYLTDNTNLTQGKAKFLSSAQAKFLFDYFIVLGLDLRAEHHKQSYKNSKFKSDTLYDYLIYELKIEPAQDIRTKFRDNQDR